MDRNTCPRCAIKHLGQAMVLVLETYKGYPHHVWFALAHMAEAEDELLPGMPVEANMIREQRVLLEKDFTYAVPWKKLMYAIAKSAVLPEILDEHGNVKKEYENE